MIPVVEAGEFREGRKKFRYLVDDEPTRSVTEIIEYAMGKGKFPAGSWWGQGQTVANLRALEDAHPDPLPDDPEEVVRLLKANKLTVFDTRDEAAERGQAIHQAAESWASEGIVPNPADYDPAWRGYVQALARFITDYQPTFLDTEVVVGSAEHRYAGTYDMRVRIGDRVGLGDWKTGKRLYEEVFFQLEAYELASVECGADPTDFRFAVHLGQTGEYAYEESQLTAEHWLALLPGYRAQVEAAELRKKAA